MAHSWLNWLIIGSRLAHNGFTIKMNCLIIAQSGGQTQTANAASQAHLQSTQRFPQTKTLPQSEGVSIIQY